ncbi:MAG: RNA polymerase sigma factor [Minicystis sp.]
MSDLLAAVVQTRERFLDLVAEVRPDLHRYCARMTGSVFDGEDVVQDTLAKAYFALAEMASPPPLRPWLFRIAHNAAMDFLRRRDHRLVVATDDIDHIADRDGDGDGDGPEPDGERVEHALRVFAALPPVQRSALALKDVVGLSLEECAETMGVSVLAVKAALVRARANLERSEMPPAPGPDDLARLRHYAALFNARDWDGLRALFGDETRLDVVSRYQRRGPPAASYFHAYAERAPGEDLRAAVGWVDGVPVLAMFRPATSERPAYFVRIDWRGDGITQVRDFRYIPYIAHEATFTPA